MNLNVPIFEIKEKENSNQRWIYDADKSFKNKILHRLSTHVNTDYPKCGHTSFQLKDYEIGSHTIRFFVFVVGKRKMFLNALQSATHEMIRLFFKRMNQLNYVYVVSLNVIVCCLYGK